MVSAAFQALGLALCVIAWIASIAACVIPHWRVTYFLKDTKMVWEGLWLCYEIERSRIYNAYYFSSDLLAARALTIISILIGIVGIFLGIAGGKCTNCVKDERSKARIRMASGIIFIIAGVFYLIPVSWTSVYNTKDVDSPLLQNARETKLGSAFFIGCLASVLFILGGAILCVKDKVSAKNSAPRSSAAKDYV